MHIPKVTQDNCTCWELLKVASNLTLGEDTYVMNECMYDSAGRSI